ncbi:hypothetical protein A3A09_01510 [Candidatus Nomurabacteria bacterium RIFCSPLOWO2_01_FULL_42_20]|uniref:Uncharacterized protein n=1 Tax=Candidatus Nomurabacteria bacterium RIFCSPHIGHO2_01_FULL_42_16 TaxID=1801743 RepID=A0A1F6VLX3_9BACT|nr:MAG: hypothetical protein A2824_00195 [Candidatus Nomurabacteria bacterium RIFCSPHIGHO2_01_FULL_42_16]OGI92466.1 MAG: hypothetical protein A3A09_01510 [Candidatus Nomurabacteria bacterium RIFCSPLOWO2_01_FULL_42_20]
MEPEKKSSGALVGSIIIIIIIVIAAVLLFRTRAPQAPVQEGQVQVEEEADLSQIEAELEALNIEELNLEVE